MSLPINSFINGTEPEIPLATRVRNQLLNAGIQNFEVEELPNGALVFKFTGALQPQTVGILNANGFRARTGNLGGDVVNPPL